MLSKYGDHRAQTPTPALTLVVRPDRARFQLHVSVEADSASQALPLLRRAVQRLEELLPPLQATLTVTDFDLPTDGKGVSQVHAVLELPLSKEAPFWDRAQRLAQLDDLLRALAQEGRKQKPALDVRRDLPVFVVADPEAHRATLVQRLHERAKSVSGEEALLKALQFDCPVTQRAVSLEEVELSLPVQGTLQSKLR